MSTNTFNYQGTLAKQRGSSDSPRLFLFQAQASDVLKWAFVDRLEPTNQSGIQRAYNPRKVKDISRYFLSDTRNIIPTAVVVAFKAGADNVSITGQTQASVHPTAAELRIVCSIEDPDTRTAVDYPCIVIDGQHRLLGMAEAADQPLIVNVVALLDVSQEEIAFQFLVINNKASKVDRKHLRNLALDYQQEDLNTRLKQSANMGVSQTALSVLDAAAYDDRSPFYHQLALPAFHDKFVLPNSLELAYEFVSAASPADLEEEDKIWFFLYIWKAVKEHWVPDHPELWQEGSKLLSKVGLICFTQYLVTTINSAATLSDVPPDLRDEDAVRQVVVRILEKFDPEFFLAKWKKTELDTRVGRELLLEAINKAASNVRYKQPWYQGVSLIDQSSFA